MFDVPFSKKELILTLVFSFLILLLIFLYSFNHSQTTLVFCDVGQGDGAYIRINNQTDILIDAGPNRKILECLGRHMPFFDRTFELAVVSHAQKDHFGGFLYILDRYDIEKFWVGETYNNSKIFTELINKIKSKNINLEFPLSGDESLFTNAKFDFFWPSEKFIAQNSFIDSTMTTPFKYSHVDLNNFSLVFSLQVKDVNILFTGDAGPEILNGLLQNSKLKTDILKIPHHGSKNGLTADFLKLADPTYAVISSGKNNSYGHPHEVILNLLKTQNIKIKRTDEEGDIIFKFD